MAKNNGRRKQRFIRNVKTIKGSMSDRTDNSNGANTQSNRKESKTTNTNNKSFTSDKCHIISEEMQRIDCDIQRDQQLCDTTNATDAVLNSSDNQDRHKSNAKSDDLNSNDSVVKMQTKQRNGQSSSDDNGSQTDSQAVHNKRLNNRSNNKQIFNINNDLKVKAIENNSSNHNSRIGTIDEKKVEEESDAQEKYKCPVCDLKLESQHTFTIHIRQHNPSDHSHTCRLCGKTLSSASSLDRHMLIHSGERPFKCRICNMAFTTNGNMHRHMRTHGSDNNNDECNNDSNNNNNKLIKSKKRKVSEDDNRDNRALVSKPSPKRRNSDVGADLSVPKSDLPKSSEIHCPVCKKSELKSKSELHTHMSTVHPNDPICCRDCGMIVNNYATYTQHRCTATASVEGTTSLLSPNRMNFSSAPAVGFYDLSFTDFSSHKFSMIAKSFCEHNLRKASSPYHDFECDKCNRSFPCGSALNLHQSSHEGQTYCQICQHDFITPSQYMSHQIKHRIDYPMSMTTSAIPEPHKSSYGDVPQSDKEDFLALLDLQNKGSQMNCIQSNYKFTRSEEPFDNNSYYIHAKPIPPRPTTFQPKVIINGSETESNKHDLADIQSIISVTSSAGPLMSSIRSSPPAASPASPVHLGVSGTQPDSPVAADSATASPNTPSHNSSKIERDEKQLDSMEASDKVLSIVTEAENGLTFKCSKCPQIFKNQNALKRHNRGHTLGGHSYACHLCSYTSLDKSTLVRHLRTHNGERPFQCSICKYAFTTKANCERHVRKRHKKLQKNEIRSAMQYNPNMSTNSSLTQQNLTKTDTNLSLSPASDTFPGGFDTVCKYCNVDFKFNRVLRHHLRSLHNSCSRKPYCCTVCKLGFSTKNNCIRHVVKQHPEMKDKLGSVVLANASAIGLNSDQSESESVFRDSPEMSSNLTKDSMNFSTDNSMNGSFSETSGMSVPQHHSSLAALCQIAKNIANNENPMNSVLDLKVSVDDDDETDCEEQPLNLASHSHEEQPLDLAVHALDLSCKSSIPKGKVCEDMKVNEAVRTAASSLLALRSMASTSVFPTTGLLGSGLPNQLFHPSISLTPPLPAHTSPSLSILSPNSGASMEDIYKVTTYRMSKNRLLPRNERSFTCVYCSAGFTLKSNMERHIKRKHPEFARPPRSRGVSSAAQQTQSNTNHLMNHSTTSLLSKTNNATLSSKTRAALRVVLNNKVMSSSTGNTNNSRPSSPVDSTPNNMISKSGEDCSGYGADTTGDLASVSSLIDHSANSSNALKQYFNKQNEDMDSNVDQLVANIQKSETKTATIRPNDTKTEKSFHRKKSKDFSPLKDTAFVTKKRSAYTDSPNSVCCPYCSRKFPWTSSLRRHILTHTGIKPYKCPKCPILFTTKSNCERHLVRKHNGKDKKLVVEQPVIPQDSKPFKCKTCPNSTFTTQGNLRKHHYLRHFKTGKQNNVFNNKKEVKTEEEMNETIANITAEDDLIDDRLNFRCYLCETSFNGRQKCLKHIQSSHPIEYEVLESKGAVDRVPTSDTNLMVDNHNDEYDAYDKVLCAFCPRKFQSMDSLRRHMSVHLGIKGFHCTHCPKRFSLKNSLLRHHRSNHPDRELPLRRGKSKQPIVPTVCSATLLTESENQTTIKGSKPKGSCNSLLYLIPNDSVKQSETFAQNVNSSDGDNGDNGSGSDLIQNLLGLQDSKILDDLLDSGADSAARILGVKDLA